MMQKANSDMTQNILNNKGGIYISNGKLTNWLLGIIGTCSIAGIVCAVKLISKIPEIQNNSARVERKVDDIQNSLNKQSDRLTLYSEEQIRQGEQLNFLKNRVK